MPTLLGNQVFPFDDPWNQIIGNAPVAANSSTLVDSIGATKGLKADFGKGLREGANIGIPYDTGFRHSPGPRSSSTPAPDESGFFAGTDSSERVLAGDPLPGVQTRRPSLMVCNDNNVLYELFNAYRPVKPPTENGTRMPELVWDLRPVAFFRPAAQTWPTPRGADLAGLCSRTKYSERVSSNTPSASPCRSRRVRDVLSRVDHAGSTTRRIRGWADSPASTELRRFRFLPPQSGDISTHEGITA